MLRLAALTLILPAMLTTGCAGLDLKMRSPAAASFSESAEAKRVPWSGYWWSMLKAELALGWSDGAGRRQWTQEQVLAWDKCLGSKTPACRALIESQSGAEGRALSPLMKFDLWNTRKYGLPSHAARRELEIHYIGDNRSHRYWESRGYAGKCIGWALSTRDYDEPTTDKVLDGIVFRPADIKGILAAIYNGAQFFVPEDQVFGTEFHDASDHSRAAYEDVSPQDFVRALRKSIGKGDVLEGDLEPGDGVWNYPVHRYEMDWRMMSATQARVHARIFYADDEVGIDEVFSGQKPRKDLLSRDLDFELTLPPSSKGDLAQALTGKWLGKSADQHPDVLILGLEPGWRKTIYDYEDSEMKQEVNFPLIRRTRVAGKWVPSVDELLRSYYSH